VHHATIMKSSRFRSSRDVWLPMIHGSELGAIGSCSMFVLGLNSGRLDVLFSSGPLFLGGLARANAAVATVVADAC
jgi:hypothetical protein